MLEFLINANSGSGFPYKGVKLQDGSFLSYQEWLGRLKDNFDGQYWSKQGYYKDVLGCSDI